MPMTTNAVRVLSEAHNPALAADAMADPPVLRCACGYDRHHRMVRAEPNYGFGGWICLIVGVTARPERISFRCRRCYIVIEESTALDALDNAY